MSSICFIYTRYSFFENNIKTVLNYIYNIYLNIDLTLSCYPIEQLILISRYKTLEYIYEYTTFQNHLFLILNFQIIK